MKNNYKHGLSYLKEYDTFLNLRARCNKSNHPDYKNYGARGIRVYGGWLVNPKLFIDYIKALPNYGVKGLTLDRINNDGNYEPGNLRWATRATQTANSRVNNKHNNIPHSGYIGITWDIEASYWRVRIYTGSKRVSLGYFKTIQEALERRNDYIKTNNLVFNMEIVNEIPNFVTL